MKYTKHVSVGEFAKKGVDINNNDLITIANEGKQVQSTFDPEKTQDVFLVKLINGEEKNINVNKTSLNGLIDAFGDESINWVGKQVKVWIIKSNVAGKFVDVLYISHPMAQLTTEGFVLPQPKSIVPKRAKTFVKEVEAEEEGYPEGEDVE